MQNGSPAAKAGLRAGDVVTAVGSNRVETGDDLIALIRSNSPGTSVAVHYTRGGQSHSAQVTLGQSS